MTGLRGDGNQRRLGLPFPERY
ncbi:hypothetical protein SPHINGO391_350102 [Sphingomonas aurantiaca]|uniref:Uncharacterized protein n=1 Tax=Sphingomonas aurantiaca TaxID=185949 RepID=A0A5E7Y290_9SPHN|nr:hypothetical protein SPHINGO391_350102 [Sphingomonas aurantiaca]